jgi:hypothetical protein
MEITNRRQACYLYGNPAQRLCSEVDSYDPQDDEDIGCGADRGVRAVVGCRSRYSEKDNPAPDEALVARRLGRCGSRSLVKQGDRGRKEACDTREIEFDVG